MNHHALSYMGQIFFGGDCIMEKEKTREKKSSRYRESAFNLRSVSLSKNQEFFLIKSLIFTTGLLFGYSVSVGLGLTKATSIVFGLISGLGVVLTGSLVAFLLIQAVSLA